MANKVTINGNIPVVVEDDSFEWHLTEGLDPYSGRVMMRKSEAEDIYSKQFVSFEWNQQGGNSIEFKNVVVGDIEPPDINYHARSSISNQYEHLVSVELLDVRHVLKFGSYANNFNMYDANYLWNREIISDAFISNTLASGNLWTVEQILQDILDVPFDPYMTSIVSYETHFHNTAKIENFSVEGSVYDCLQQLLNHPSCYNISCFLKPDGVIHFVERDKPIDIQTTPGMSPFQNTQAGKYGKVKRETKRPKKVTACYPIVRRCYVNSWDTVLPADRTMPYTLGAGCSFTSGSSNVTGTGTQFTKNVQPDTWIKAPSGDKYKVQSVTDDTTLTLYTTASTTESGTTQLVEANDTTWVEGEFVDADTLLSTWGYSLTQAKHQIYAAEPYIDLMATIDLDSALSYRQLKSKRIRILDEHLYRTFRPGGTTANQYLRMNPDREIIVKGDYYEEDLTAATFDNVSNLTVDWKVECLDPSKAIIQVQTPNNIRMKCHLTDEEVFSVDFGMPLVEQTTMKVWYYNADIPTSASDYYQSTVIENTRGLGTSNMHMIRDVSALIDEEYSTTTPINLDTIQQDVEMIKDQFEYEFQDIYTGDFQLAGLAKFTEFGIKTNENLAYLDSVQYRNANGEFSTRVQFFRKKPRRKYWKNERELRRIKRRMQLDQGYPSH